MKEIKAFIRERKTNTVIEELRRAGFYSLTVSEAEGTGKYTKKEDMPSLRFPVTHSKVSKLEIVCEDEEVDPIVKIIHHHGRSGEKGDGLIYVSEIIKVFDVSTGLENKD